MTQLIGIAKLHEFSEYGEVILRIHTKRGSFPIVIVENGEFNSAEKIGEQILNSFRYHVQTTVVKDSVTG